MMKHDWELATDSLSGNNDRICSTKQSTHALQADILCGTTASNKPVDISDITADRCSLGTVQASSRAAATMVNLVES